MAYDLTAKIGANPPVVAAVAKVKEDIDLNHTGVAPEGEMARHKDPFKVDLKDAIDAVRAVEEAGD